MAAEQCARRAMEHGVRKVDVMVKGPGSGRETAIRSIQNAGIEVTGIKDVTPVPAQRLPPAQASEGLTWTLRFAPRHLGTTVTGPNRPASPRRLGTNIWGTKGETIALDKRPYPPGEHGRTRRRGNVSEYLLQMQEKQKARFTYGLSERQFRNLYEEANRRTASPARSCCASSSSASTTSPTAPAGPPPGPRPASSSATATSQVNGKRVDIPSYRVRKGDVITLKGKSREMVVVQWNTDVLGRTPAALARGQRRRLLGHRLASCPLREHIDVPVREQLIVELYSK